MSYVREGRARANVCVREKDACARAHVRTREIVADVNEFLLNRSSLTLTGSCCAALAPKQIKENAAANPVIVREDSSDKRPEMCYLSCG